MTGGLDAVPSRVGGDTSGRVDHGHLAGLPQGVLRQESGEGLFRVVSGSEEVQ